MAGSTSPPQRGMQRATHIDGDSISERVAVGAVMRETPGWVGGYQSTDELDFWSRNPFQSALFAIQWIWQDMVHGAEDVLFGSRGSLRSYAMAPCSLATRALRRCHWCFGRPGW